MLSLPGAQAGQVVGLQLGKESKANQHCSLSLKHPGPCLAALIPTGLHRLFTCLEDLPCTPTSLLTAQALES